MNRQSGIWNMYGNSSNNSRLRTEEEYHNVINLLSLIVNWISIK